MLSEKIIKIRCKSIKNNSFLSKFNSQRHYFFLNINPNQTLEIFNVDGEMVRIIERVNANQPINIGQFPTGFYFLKIGKKVMKLVYK